MSYSKFKTRDLRPLGGLIIKVFRTLRVLEVRQDEEFTECNNMTILNLLLMYLGPLHEHTLVVILLAIQVSDTQ